MKWLLIAIAILSSASVLARSGGGPKSVACYIDGEYTASFPVYECRRIGGKVYGEKGWDKKAD